MTENEQQTVDLSVGPLGSFDDAVAFGDALYALEGVTRLALNEFNDAYASFTFTVRSVEAVRDGLLMMPEFSVASVDRGDNGSIQVAIGERPYDAYVAEHGGSAEDGQHEETPYAGAAPFAAEEVAAEAHQPEMPPQPYEILQPQAAVGQDYAAFPAQNDATEGGQPMMQDEAPWMNPAEEAEDRPHSVSADPFRPQSAQTPEPPLPFPAEELELPAPWLTTEVKPPRFESEQGASPMAEVEPPPVEATPAAPFAADGFRGSTDAEAASDSQARPASHGIDVSAVLIEMARELRDQADALAELAARVAEEEESAPEPPVAETAWESDAFSVRSWENDDATPSAPSVAETASEAQQPVQSEDSATDGWTPGTPTAWVPVVAEPAEMIDDAEPRAWEAPRMPSVGAMAPAHPGQGESGTSGAQAIAMATAMGRKPSQVHLLASGFASFGIANTFIAAVRQIAGVRNVAISELDQGRLRLTLDYFGTDSLEQQLQQLTDFPHEVVRASGKEIEIQLQAA